MPTSFDVEADTARGKARFHVTEMLAAEHTRLRALLSFIERRCAALEGGDDCEIEPALDAARHIQGFLSTVHRPKENALFRRAFDESDSTRRVPGISARCDHERCDDSGARFIGALSRAHNGEILLREEVVRHGTVWIGQLRALIRNEEGAAYDRAAAGLTHADWCAIEAAIARLERRQWHARLEQDLDGFERASERQDAHFARVHRNGSRSRAVYDDR